ncbi:sulfatase-like hydrolase/transferase [Gilvimarinus agarilyticus]|uniref:sulfatase-like hydrolase/transferase n=1 Tax=Gilvimarinus agarilyticus TaxID=679259 RepID=UPI0005A0F5DD|nr:sulfatase-like hydrolase/transferase [Gilvimarinus agarilyticus]
MGQGFKMVLFSSLLAFGATAYASDEQPNILWIITDDHRPDSIQAYNRATTGNDHSELGYVQSPNIDQLASEGVMFTRAYNQSPACGPSRTSMHTGRYPFRNGKYAWEQTHQQADFTRPAVSQQLAGAGYATAIIGKQHLGISERRGGQGGIFEFDIDFHRDLNGNGLGGLYYSGSAYGLRDALLLRQDATETVHYPNGKRLTYTLSKADRPLNDEERSVKKNIEDEFDILRAYTRINKGLILGGVNPQPADKTVDAYIVKEFESYLENSGKDYTSSFGKQLKGADSNKPLFVNLGFHLPHTPVLPPKSFRDQFSNKHYKLPVFDTEEMATFVPQQMQIYNESKTHGMTDAEKQQAIRDYYAFTAFGDHLIGQAVDAFKSYSKAQGRDYLIVFTVGDHGWHLGEQGIMAKFTSWKQSLNGAVIVVSSDKEAYPPGKVVDKMVEYVDFAPTFLSAAGEDLTDSRFDYLDGYDLARVSGDPALSRDYIIGEMNLVNGHRAYLRSEDFAFSMRTRDRRTPAKSPLLNDDIRWALEVHPVKAEMALYDLRRDPLERNNLAYTQEYLPLAQWFREKLGNIVLGDGRIEMDWNTDNQYSLSNFAAGADDKVLDIPPELIPDPELQDIQRPNY